jgi:hypothetical protein
LRERIVRLVDLSGPFIVFLIIMGSVYTGWATVTESAALSVIAALGIAAFNRTLSIRMLHDAFVATANLTAITMLILAVAFYLNFALGSLNITQTLGAFVAGLGHSTTGLMWILAVFYFLLGIFFETLPMMVGTVPIIFPIAVATGIDPIWFGVFMVLQCELSLLSPPVGMTLYVIQAVRREGTSRTCSPAPSVRRRDGADDRDPDSFPRTGAVDSRASCSARIKYLILNDYSVSRRVTQVSANHCSRALKKYRLHGNLPRPVAFAARSPAVRPAEAEGLRGAV